jgi:predicted transcriptional regulator
MKNPANWYDVYPRNTKEGDEEAKVFTSLARSKWKWRSVGAIAKETGLEKERIENILYKYYKKGMVLQNPKSEEQWGYWINFPELISKQQKPSIKQEDINKRMNMMVVAPSCSKNSIF